MYDYDEEEGYEPPIPVRRKSAAGYTTTTYSHPVVQPLPPQRKRQHHVLEIFGIGMLLMCVLWTVWLLVVVPWITSVESRWNYGPQNIFLMGADVGHGGTSRFIAFDDQTEIVVVEVVKKKYIVYTIPVSEGSDRLVTLDAIDVNHDGKIDLVVRMGETAVVLWNTGSSFQLTK